MGTEIERRFLVDAGKWASMQKPPGRNIRLGYLIISERKSLRVRIVDAHAWLGIKQTLNALTREQFEYDIPLADAEEMMDGMVDGVVEKTRYNLPFGGHTWEIDEYHGTNKGLLVAEVELSHAGETVELPNWVVQEVTNDFRYLNHSLALWPWSAWSGTEVTIINLSGFPVVLLDEQGLVFREFPPAETAVCMSSTHLDTGYALQQVPVTRPVFGPAEGLPEPQPGVYYIVSYQVKVACAHRNDLLVPANAVKESGGILWGFMSLST